MGQTWELREGAEQLEEPEEPEELDLQDVVFTWCEGGQGWSDQLKVAKTHPSAPPAPLPSSPSLLLICLPEPSSIISF